MSRLADLADRASRAFAGRGPVDTVVELVRCVTLLDFLLRPIGPWWIRPLVLSLSGLGLIAGAVRRSSWTWGALALLSAARVACEWPVADNHAYLLSYWCLAHALAASCGEPRALLRRSARVMVALVFLLATTWKALLSPDYLDGRFFRVALLTDPRFANVAMLVGGLDRDAITETRAYLVPQPGHAEVVEGPRNRETPALRALATGLTWSCVVLEGLVALAWLAPGGAWVERARHALLLVFCAGTYAIAPVAGFGWLLLAMGLAQCRPEQRAWKASYLVAFFLVLFYHEVPLTRLALELSRGRTQETVTDDDSPLEPLPVSSHS